MTDREHTHRSVSGWIGRFDNVDDRESLLKSCPRAREAWDEGIEPWLRHAVECPACREVAKAQELFADEHLDCPGCRDNLEVVYHLLAETEHYEPATVRELQRAEGFLEEIADLPLDEQMECALTEPFYQQWGFVQHVLADARAHWHRDPELALERALLAVVAVGKLLPESYGAEWIADLAAKAHAYAANAHRILGSFGAAEAEFAVAEEHLARGVRSGQAAARVFALKASLLNDQRRHREALALLEHVERFHQERREDHEVGRLALKRAHILYSMAEPDRAAGECTRASNLLDSGYDPLLPLLARKNAIEYLLSAGRVDQARVLFDELPRLPELLADLRRSWVEANLLRAERRYGLAREAYERVRAAFADAGLFYDTALLSLDLALTAYQHGEDRGEVHRLANEASAQLTLAGARPEAFTALRLVLTAAREDALTVALLEQVRRRLATLQPS